MRSPRTNHRLSSFATLTAVVGAVLVFHGAAFAQQTEKAGTSETTPPAASQGGAAASPSPSTGPSTAPAQPAPQPAVPPDYGPPPGYGPSPGYAPPPQGYPPNYYNYGYPPPRGYYSRPRYYSPPPASYPAPTGYRGVFFGLGLGVGGMSIFPANEGSLDTSGEVIENASRTGFGYSLRLGFGVSPRWSLLFSGDGAWAFFNGYNVSQTAWTIGPQVFLTHNLYVRAGLGVATYSQSWDDGYYLVEDYSDSGMAATAAVGFEFMQSYHTAMGLEFAATLGSYPNDDKVSTMGINFVLNMF